MMMRGMREEKEKRYKVREKERKKDRKKEED